MKEIPCERLESWVMNSTKNTIAVILNYLYNSWYLKFLYALVWGDTSWKTKDWSHQPGFFSAVQIEADKVAITSLDMVFLGAYAGVKGRHHRRKNSRHVSGISKMQCLPLSTWHINLHLAWYYVWALLDFFFLLVIHSEWQVLFNITTPGRSRITLDHAGHAYKLGKTLIRQ